VREEVTRKLFFLFFIYFLVEAASKLLEKLDRIGEKD